MRVQIAMGAEVDCANWLGFTPLMGEAAMGNGKTCSLLLRHGASCSLRGAHPSGFLRTRGPDGRCVGAPLPRFKGEHSAAEWADLYGHATVARMLRAAPGAQTQPAR